MSPVRARSPAPEQAETGVLRGRGRTRGSRTEVADPVIVYKPETKFRAVLRAFERLQNLARDAGTSVEFRDHSVRDAAFTFFQECYHLKDWLKKDARIPRPQDAKDFIHENKSHTLAADLCNS